MRVGVRKKGGFPNKGEWKVLQRVVDSMNPIMTASLAGGLTQFKRGINLRLLETLIRERRWTEIENVIPFTGILNADQMDRLYQGALLQSSASSQAFFKRTVARIIPTVNASGFNVTLDNPRVNRYIFSQTSNLIQGVTRESQVAIRAAINNSIAQGLPPRTTAMMIRDSVGLTTQQQAAVEGFRAKLTEGIPSKLTSAQRESLMRSTRRRTTVDQRFFDKLSPERVERLTTDYANRQLAHRAKVIAQNELQEAVNYGQRETWQQAAEEGLVDLQNDRKQWVVTDDDRLCEICEPMQGVETGMNEMFELPSGSSVEGPPGHIGCRCVLTLVFAEERTIR